MKSLLLLVLVTLFLQCGSVSHMKLHSRAQSKASKMHSMCQNGEVDCTDAVQVLRHISDMISQETVSKTEFTFRQRVHFMEQIIVELTHLSEYYELRQLQQNYELNIRKDHLYFWNVFIKTMHKQYEIRTQELIGTYFINSVIFAMRLQVYTSIRMVSMIHNLEYTLMSNNFAYDVFTVSRSFFQITVDYFRLVQVDRLMAKGVLFQISEQIAHAQFNLQFQKGISKGEQESGLQALNHMWATYEGQVMTETETYTQQFSQLVLVQKIQYQYEQYAKDTSKVLSKNGMKAIASHLSDLSFRDSKIFVDYVETRKQPRMMQASVFQDWHNQAYKARTFSVLEPANTFQDLPAMEAFTDALLAPAVKGFPFHDTRYFKQNELGEVKLRHSLHPFTKESVEKMHAANPYIKDYIGLDNGAVQGVRMALDTVYSFLDACREKQVFPEQIGQLINFSAEADTTENIYSAVMASFVSLKEGYDNYVNWAYQFYQVHQQMQEEVERTFEYQELMKLLKQRIEPMQEKLNKRLKLHQAQLFNDFLSLLVEVRNYNKLQQLAIKHMPEGYLGKTAGEQNAILLDYLNKHYQTDYLKFYDRFQYKLNSFFLTQSNVIASVKAFSMLMSDQLIKIYYVLEKKIFPYFLSPLEKQTAQKNEKRLKKKYLKRLSKRVQALLFIQMDQSRRRLKDVSQSKAPTENDAPKEEVVSQNAMLPDYRVDMIHSRDKLTIYYQKIEGSAFYKQQVLFTRVRLYNNLLLKFMMKKYTATSHTQQKYVGSPFEDYEKHLDGVVSRTMLFRVDAMLTGANTIEMEQYGERKAFLKIMERHKCALIRIYRSFQMSLKEYYVSARISIDLNYQEFILRVRQAFYLYVSDLEVVVVDETENYYNTINQLKIMGYDEITFPQYQGKNPLLQQLVSYKQQVQDMSDTTLVRVFYCQGCFNRILRQLNVYSYSDYSYEALLAYMQTVITTKTTETGLHYYYDISMVVFEQSSMTQSVFYVVKVYERVSAYHLMISTTKHRQEYSTEVTTTTTDIQTTRTDSTRTIQTVVINGHCVLDYFFSTSKSYSIYDQVITRSEHVSETYSVQTVVTSVDIDSVEFQNMRTAVHSYFYDTTIQAISGEYKNFLYVYDDAAYHFSEKIIKQDTTVDLDFNSYFRYYVYVPRKLIYQDYMLLLQFEWFVQEQLITDKIGAVVSISSFVSISDLACQCRQFDKPDCFFTKDKLAALRDYKMEEPVTKKFTNKWFQQFNRKLFGSNEWKVGQTQTWGKVFSKVTNLVMDMTRESFEVTGTVLATKKIETWNDFLDILSMEEAVTQSSLDQGLNVLPVSVYENVKDASAHLEQTLFKVTDKHLRFHAHEFPAYEDDLRFAVVVNMMKLAFMFPAKMVPENILDNGIEFRTEPSAANKAALQEVMNSIYADNDMYTIYIGRMDEVIENKEYLRVYVDGTECVGHKAQVVSAEQARFFTDVIDPEYVVTEVFYYFEQERQMQYVQDLLAVNYNDPFYKTLYALGFRPVGAPDGDLYSVYGFYDFKVTYNEDVTDKCAGQQGGEAEGSEWMYKKPSRGMKRIWVRPMQYCQDTPSSADLYCNPRTGKVKEDVKDQTEVQKAHSAFTVQYTTMTQVYKLNQKVDPYFSRKTYGNEISTVTKILRETGAKGVDSRAYTQTDDDLHPEKQDIGGVSANHDFLVAVQPFYRFLDAGMTGQYDYFADRQMLAYSTQEDKHDLAKNLSQERARLYRFHDYSEKVTSKQHKYQVSNYNAFSYISARDEKARKCYSNSEPDIPTDVYLKIIEKMHNKVIAKEVNVMGDCYNPAQSYIAYSYEKVIQTLFEFSANVCVPGPKRMKKNHSKKRRHRKRRTHKRKHVL